jgi:hypothetical protein
VETDRLGHTLTVYPELVGGLVTVDDEARDTDAGAIWADRSTARWCAGLAGLGCTIAASGAVWTRDTPSELLSASAIAAVLAFVALRCADRSRRPVLEFGAVGFVIRRWPLPGRDMPWSQVRYMALAMSRGYRGSAPQLVLDATRPASRRLAAPIVIEPVLGLGPPASLEALGGQAEQAGADVAWRPSPRGRYVAARRSQSGGRIVARATLRRGVAVFTLVVWLGVAAVLTEAGTHLTTDRVALLFAVGLGLSVAAYPRGRWVLQEERLRGPRGAELAIRPSVEVRTAMDRDGHGLVHIRNGDTAVAIPLAWLPLRLEPFLRDLGLERV